MNRAEKQSEVEFLKGAFNGSQIALCADSRGLNVLQVTGLRRELKAAGARARVVKNTLAKLAVKDAFKAAKQDQVERFLKLFEGPSLVILAENDPVGPAKVLSKLAKELENLKIKGAWFEDAFLDQAGVGTLSSMPGREELLGKFLNLLNAPGTQLVRLMQEPSAQLVRLLEAQRAKLEGASA